MRITEEEMQDRRALMIKTAYRLFSDHGIEHVSLARIAKKAGLSENTLYRYFDNKETLVLETFAKLWDTMMRQVEQIVAQAPCYDALTGYEQMRVWIEGFRHLYQADADFVLFSCEAKLYLLRHSVRIELDRHGMLMHPFCGPCMAALEKGKADGSIPTQESSEDLFYAIWGAIRGYVVKIVIYGALYGDDSPWESRFQVMERGILSALHAGWIPPDDDK